jgi:hypothetical protein
MSEKKEKKKEAANKEAGQAGHKIKKNSKWKLKSIRDKKATETMKTIGIRIE